MSGVVLVEGGEGVGVFDDAAVGILIGGERGLEGDSTEKFQPESLLDIPYA